MRSMEYSHHSQQTVSARTLWYLLLVVVSVILTVVALFYDFLFPIVAILGILFFAVVIHRPFWGFLLFVALIYLRPSDLFPILTTLRFQPLLLGLLIVLWLYRDFVRSKNQFNLHRIDLAILAFVVVMLLSIVTSIYIGQSVSVFTDYIKLLAFYLLATQMVKSKRQLKAFIAVLLGSVTFVSLVQVYTYLTIGLTRATGQGGYGIHIGPLHLYAGRAIGEQATNVHGVGGYSNGFLANASELGLGVLMVIPFAYYLCERVSSRFVRIVLILVLVILTFSLIVTGSRGATLAAFVVLLIIFFKSRHKMALAMVLILGLMVATPLLSDNYIDRVTSITEYESDTSANIRLSLWKAGLYMMMDRPLLGIGVGNFHNAYGGEYRETDSANLWWQPHNNFIQVGAEMGLLGLVAYVWILIMILKENRRSRRILALEFPAERSLEGYLHASDVSLYGCIVAGCFITSTYYPHILILALMARSMGGIIENKIKNRDLVLIEETDTDLTEHDKPPLDGRGKTIV